MPKPALVIDMLARPGGADEEASPSEEAALDDAPGRTSQEDPETLIADIRAQLAALEQQIAGLR